MLKRLDELGLITHVPYRGVRLTDDGRRIALEVIRHHRLLESYLAEALEMPWDRVHDEAEVLEHVISEDLEALIAAKLGHPTVDPHGDPIPTRELELEEAPTRRLESLEPGEEGVFVRVSDSDPEMLRYLDGAGSRPACLLGARAPALRRAAVRRLRRREHAIGGGLARAMRVEIEAEADAAIDEAPRGARASRGTHLSAPEATANASPVLRNPPLSEEDAARSHDRSRVHHARRNDKHWRLLWLLVGPGILAMIGENDGPSMIAYASDGAQYGLGLFVPLIPVLFALAYVCQEMCMRVGAVTHRGYGELVLQRYGRVWGWFGAGDLCLTNLVTLIAEFVAIRVGLAYFGLDSGVAVALGLALVLFTFSGGRYWRWERTVLGLALFNGLFLVAAILAHPNLGKLAHSLTFTPLPHGSLNTLLLLMASTVGATVTPWMIFFQQSASADKGMTPSDVRHGRYDTALGAVLAAIFGIGALVAGAALLRSGSGIQGFAGAGFPAALSHVVGCGAGALFALGLVEAGAVAILTISASTAYAAGECIGVSHSFNTSPRNARCSTPPTSASRSSPRSSS